MSALFSRVSPERKKQKVPLTTCTKILYVGNIHGGLQTRLWRHCWWTHRGQRQAKVGGLMLHVDLDLVEERLDSFILKSVPVSDEVKSFISLPRSCSPHRDLATL